MMSSQSRARQTTRPGRRVLAQMSTPALIAFALVSTLTLVCRLLSVVAGLIAEISERLADAGDSARAAARSGMVITTVTGGAG
jgi:hypothetical protein